MSTEPNTALRQTMHNTAIDSTTTSTPPFVGPINQISATHREPEQHPQTPPRTLQAVRSEHDEPPTRSGSQAEQSSENPETTTLLHALLTRFDDFAKGTDHRFNRLFAAQLTNQNRINEIQSSQASPEPQHTPHPLPTQRTLFGDDLTPPTNLIGTNDQHPAFYSQHNAERNGHDAEIERMNDQLHHMNSRIHQATSSAPEID